MSTIDLRRLSRWCVLAAGVVAGSAVTAQDWQPVIAQLRAPQKARRLDALKQLNAAGYAPSAEFVAPLVTDPEDDVQAAAIDASLTFFLTEPIGDRGSRSRAQEAFDAGPLVRTAAVAPEILIDQLITATADRHARIRFDALHALGVIGEPAFGVENTRRLMAGLQHPDPVIRTATARVLGRLRAASAGDALVMALNDPSELVQTYATEALGLIRNDRAVQALTDRLNYFGKGPMADASALALARIGYASSRDMFRTRLGDADAAMRRAAVEGLGRLRDRESLERIRGLAKGDASNEVRLAALFALDRLGEPQAAGLAVALTQQGLGHQSRDYLFEIGPAAAPAVLNVLTQSTDPNARVWLVHLLGYIGGAAEAAALTPLSRDADAHVARAAANAVARLRR